MQKLPIIVLLTAMLITSACKKDDNCVSYEQHPILSVTGPNSGTMNEKIRFELVFQVGNSCGQMGYFSESFNENNRTIELIAKYEGCACFEDQPYRTAAYTFQTPRPGIYHLKFKSINGYIVDTLSIN